LSEKKKGEWKAQAGEGGEEDVYLGGGHGGFVVVLHDGTSSRFCVQLRSVEDAVAIVMGRFHVLKVEYRILGWMVIRHPNPV